jgi:hypothetical protein
MQSLPHFARSLQILSRHSTDDAARISLQTFQEVLSTHFVISASSCSQIFEGRHARLLVQAGTLLTSFCSCAEVVR